MRRQLVALAFTLLAPALASPANDPTRPDTPWHQQGAATPQAHRLVAQLGQAARFGLRPEDYRAGALTARLAALEHDGHAAGTAWLSFDHDLSLAARAFVHDLHYGRVDPAAAGFDLHRARDLDVEGAVVVLATTDSMDDALAGFEPRFLHYQLLKQALARYRALAEHPELTTLPHFAARALKSDEAYAGAAALHRLLVAEGDLAAPVTDAIETTLTVELSRALATYQLRHGLTPDGALGRHTFAELTTPFARRVRQIELTLERWRWLPPLTAPTIMVNIPEFRLFALRTTDDREADILMMTVIVGRATRLMRTPVFTGEIRTVVFNPYWDVPADIALREIMPKVAADPGYLERHHMELVRGPADESPLAALAPDTAAALGAGAVRLRQRPGPDNPLGAVKFILPNDHAVYLHATPEQRLFGAAQRSFSHGCIRVSDPEALAEYVLGRQADGAWTARDVREALHGPLNRRVKLVTPVPVMILYGTAMASETGQVLLFDDLYGHDRRLERLLHLGPATAGGG